VLGFGVWCAPAAAPAAKSSKSASFGPVSSFGFRVQGLGCEVEGAGFRVSGAVTPYVVLCCSQIVITKCLNPKYQWM
jgi:hypothetical protein